MSILRWKAVLVAALATALGPDAAMAQPGATAAVKQTVRLVAPPFRAPSDLYAQDAHYQDERGDSPFVEDAPMAPIPQDQAYEDHSSAPAASTAAPVSAGESASPPAPQAAVENTAGGAADDAYAATDAPQADASADSPPQPWHVPQPLFFQEHGIVWGGWLQQGLTLNGQVPNDRLNGPVATNDRSAEWQMNQAWLFFERAVQRDGEGWDLGGRLDMIYGSDARFGLNWGLENRINGENQPYGLVIPQMYAEVAYNALSVKVGHFAGLLSYEQVPAVANFFYSHSYAMAMTEPLLVTGLTANYILDEHWSVDAGFNRGWMMFEDLNQSLDFMGGLRWQNSDKSTAIRYMLDVGPQDPLGRQDRYAGSLLLERQVTEKFRYVLQHNHGIERHGDRRTLGDAQWYGLCQYFFYTIDPKWSAGMRVEWLRDNDGLFYGAGNVPGNGRAWQGGPGFAGNWYEITWGLNYRPCGNMVIRPELRYDWYGGTRDLKGDLPYDDGNKSYQFTLAADMIITF
jgi:hypothetical protein